MSFLLHLYPGVFEYLPCLVNKLLANPEKYYYTDFTQSIIFVISQAQTLQSYQSASLRINCLRNVFGVEFSRGNLPLVKVQNEIIGRIKIFINWTDPISRIKLRFRYHHYAVFDPIKYLKEACPGSKTWFWFTFQVLRI